MEIPIEDVAEGRFKHLRIMNLATGLILLVEGILMWTISSDFSVPLTTHYLSGGRGARFPDALERTVRQVRLGPLVALFLLLSGIALLLLTLPKIFKWYKSNLLRGINYARWIEYSITASIMIVVIAMLSGIYDLSTLIAIFFLNAMMILFGLLMELHNQTTERTNWTAFAFGCIAGAVPWALIWLSYGSAAADPSNRIPAFVTWILVSIFVFFNIFALNMVLQYKKAGPWRDYLFGEKVYVILSLTAKSALAWQVFAGTVTGN